MVRRPWSREEVEATVEDYFNMLGAELSGQSYSKAQHRRGLQRMLRDRSEQSIEYKHANISAILIELGFPFIPGYKPRFNYQSLLMQLVSTRLGERSDLKTLAALDADRPPGATKHEDILTSVVDPPRPSSKSLSEKPFSPTDWQTPGVGKVVNYVEREASNRALGQAGERFTVEFEKARLKNAGLRSLATKVEHVSETRGDGLGFDVLSFDESGQERLIEVKTTRWGRETPFFVTRNEAEVSRVYSRGYWLYRVFQFREHPRLFQVRGDLHNSFRLIPSSYRARVF